jgi:hypothetical protein
MSGTWPAGFMPGRIELTEASGSIDSTRKAILISGSRRPVDLKPDLHIAQLGRGGYNSGVI